MEIASPVVSDRPDNVFPDRRQWLGLPPLNADLSRGPQCPGSLNLIRGISRSGIIDAGGRKRDNVLVIPMFSADIYHCRWLTII